MIKFENEKEHLIIKIGKIKIKIGLYNLYKKKEKAIVILEQGGFGDYICCRPFFKHLKEKYNNYCIIYVCQDWTAKFSEIYDKDSIDRVIPFNRTSFKSDNLYRKNLLNYINKNYSIEKYIHLTPFLAGIGGQLKWRMYFAKKIKAKQKYIAVTRYSKCNDNQLRVFNKKIEIEPYQFCVERNKKFFEKILETEIKSFDKNINLPKLSDKRTNIIISATASDDAKMYSCHKWIKIIDYISNNIDDNSKIIFIGTRQEQEFINKILSEVKDKSKVLNLAGELDISALPYVLQKAKFMISMESGNTHLAHALNIPTLCLCGGYYYNSAQPYKNSSVNYLYSPKCYEILKASDKNSIKKLYFSNKELNVKDIQPEIIIEELNKLYFNSNSSVV